MRVPVLLNISAGLCAAFSLLGLIYVPMLSFAAPGYLTTLPGGLKLTLIVYTAVAVFGLSTAIGVLRRREWARYAILLLACILIAAGIMSIWPLATIDAAATQFITPVCDVLIGASWLLLLNAQRSRACFSRR
jgi:hypothetical protein